MNSGKGALALSLEAIVQLLTEAGADHLEHALAVEATRTADRHHLLKDRGIGEIALERRDDSGMLHFDRNLLGAVAGSGLDDRAVNLADRGAGDRMFLEGVK